MTRQYKILKGDPDSPTVSFNAINLGTPGWHITRGGGGKPSFPLEFGAGETIVETIEFASRFSDHDEAATEAQAFIKLLRDAYRYRMDETQDEAVYIVQQTGDETNARYAEIFASPDLEWPDLLDHPFETDAWIDPFILTIIRAHPWSSEAPGELPTSPVTLGASDGPASPTMVAVSNFRDDADLTHVFHYDDSTATFSANLLSAAVNTDLWPSSPAVDDLLYFGSTDIAWKHAVISIETAADVNWDLKLQYYNGSTWTDMTLGTDYTIFAASGGEVASEDDLFNQTGLWAINVFPPSDWATVSINSQTAYWVRVYLVTATSTTTIPEKDGDTIYAQRSPYVEVPAAAIKGDFPPLFNMRLWTPSGGDENPGPSSLSRILLATKARGLDTFTPFLNCGGDDNPGDWTVTQKTDATATADTEAPGGKHSAVDFGTDTTMVARVELSGSNVLSDYKGKYHLLLRVQQIGGSAGDINCRARTYLGGTGASDPYYDSINEVGTAGADQGPEVMDLGLLWLPGSRLLRGDADTLDVIFHIYAERETGSATLRIYDLILWPADPLASMGVDDFALDVDNGSGALRGGSFLEIDNGVLANRTHKYLYDGTNKVPVQPWARMNRPPEFQNLATKTRIYFLMLHYATGASVWGEDPMIATLGCNLEFEMYAHYRYALLRGSD